MQAIVTDGESTLSKGDRNVYLDGQQVRDFQDRWTIGSLSSRPQARLGPHTVEITAGTAGSRNARKRETWSLSYRMARGRKNAGDRVRRRPRA